MIYKKITDYFKIPDYIKPMALIAYGKIEFILPLPPRQELKDILLNNS